MAPKAGFVKTHVTQLANDTRAELGLGELERLDPFALATHLDIPVVPLSRFRGSTEGGAELLLGSERAAFSAITIFRGRRRLIVYNDAHSAPRIASTICHEVGHGLLLHEPKPALDEAGLRNWDPVVEREADFIAGALLMTEASVMRGARLDHSVEQIALDHGVSTEKARQRVNELGAFRRVQRERAKRSYSGAHR